MWGPQSSSLLKGPWAVHKFGGTSVANASCYRTVGTVLATTQTPKETKANTKQGVVVSAMTKITDALLKSMELAKAHNDGYVKYFREAIVDRHYQAIGELLREPHNLREVIRRDAENIEHLLRAIYLTGTLTLHYQELIVGHGEIWSAQILSAHLNELGRKSTWLDARSVLFVIPYANPLQSPEVNWDLSHSKMDSWFQAQDQNLDAVVVTGYVASLADGTPTTLKRNGSDYSGSIFGALMRAFAITIWTDVKGVYSADPRRVPGAVLLDEMSYTEALEFSFYGAKIIHPKTMIPAVRCKIPVWIRDTFNHTCPGTKITSSISDDKKKSRVNLPSYLNAEEISAQSVIMGFCTIDNLSVVAVKAAAMGSKEYAPLVIREKLINSLRDLNVPLILAAQAAPEHSIYYCVNSDYGELALSKIKEEFAEEIEKHYIHSVKLMQGYTILTGVGERITLTPGTAARFFTALHKAKVNVLGVAQNGERVICVLVESKNTINGLRTLHSTFKLSPRSVSVGLITDLDLQASGPIVQALCGMSSSSSSGNKVVVSAVVAPEGMLLAEEVTPKTLAEVGSSSLALRDLAKFEQTLLDSLCQHKIVIDLSSSTDMVQHYENWMKLGLHVITANCHVHKASPQFLLSGREKITFRQESTGRANVDLALGPLTSFARFLDQQATFEEVAELDFSVSDALSVIFNSLAAGKKFSEAVRNAMHGGYVDERHLGAELSGEKALQSVRILQSFLGEISPFQEKDISLAPLCPELENASCLSSSEVLKIVETLDAHFTTLVQNAAARKEALHFTATFDPSSRLCKVSLKGYAIQSGSFGALKDTDKLIVFKVKGDGSVKSLQQHAVSLSRFPSQVVGITARLSKIIFNNPSRS